jgi:hypothetical protein
MRSVIVLLVVFGFVLSGCGLALPADQRSDMNKKLDRIERTLIQIEAGLRK